MSLPKAKARNNRKLSGKVYKTLKTQTSSLWHRYQGPGGWLLGLTIIVTWAIYNGRLFAATGTGLLVMALVYLLQEWEWQIPRSELRKIFTGANRLVVTTVASGGLATLSTYLAISIWADSNSPWIAAGAILQGLGTLAVLLLLVGHFLGSNTSGDESELKQLIASLTDPDALKRLIAVRQLTQLVSGELYHKTQRHATVGYFRLMLASEPEPVVREALLEGLQELDENNLLGEVAKPLYIPTRQSTKAKVREPIL